MRVLYTPQVGLSGNNFVYVFNGDSITVTFDGVTDTFDFSGFPDGEVDLESIETILPIQPISYASREGGVLSVKLLNFISDDATGNEKFPEWVVV